uniref:Isocitric dehydrogenase subunit gamma n=1 Tax=Oryctolagus cuniculus TaxID=9986 RepID=A0A5F9CT22_RABIT
MALKLTTTAGAVARAVFKPAVLSRPWEQQTIPPSAKYGGRHTVTMIPGDGIGPELMLHVKSVFRHACVPVDFEEVHVSSNADEEDIRNAIMAIRRNRVALKGNIETNHNLPPSHKSRNNILRTSLDLYANVIHCKSLPGVVTRHKDIDILIVRENTEGEYSSLEHESVAGVVESLKIITKAKSLRIAEYAFKLAQESGRKKVTAVHKANIMKLGDGLFLQCCREVAAGYPQIAFESMIVDNTTMQVGSSPSRAHVHTHTPTPLPWLGGLSPWTPRLPAPVLLSLLFSPFSALQLVSRPQQFDVMVMPNLYGNIVNNVCAGLVGGPGLVAGANYGHVYAVFETVSVPATLSKATVPCSPRCAAFSTNCSACSVPRKEPQRQQHFALAPAQALHLLACLRCLRMRLSGPQRVSGPLPCVRVSPPSFLCLTLSRLPGTQARVSPIRTLPTPQPRCWPAA